MTADGNILRMSDGDGFFSSNATDAYRLVKGKAIVFIVPCTHGQAGRRVYLCECGQGELIPAFLYTDPELTEWRFYIRALEETEFDFIEFGATKRLKDKFAEKTELDNYEYEGFNGSLLEKYRSNVLKEDVLIIRTQKARFTTQNQTIGLILDSFRSNKVDIDIEKSGDLLYDTTALLCKRYTIPIAPYEKIKETCGDEFTLPDIARLSYFSYRRIVLEPDWFNQDNGPFLVFSSADKRPMLCLPRGSSRYDLIDVGNGTASHIDENAAASLDSEAYMIYRPLPAKKLSFGDFAVFCRKSIRVFDAVMLPVLTVLTALIGVLTPSVSKDIYDKYIPGGDKSVIWSFSILLGAFLLGNLMMQVVKSLVNYRLVSRMKYDVSGATLDRAFNFSETFYRKHESADLAMRVNTVSDVVGTYANVIISATVALVVVMVYLVRMFTVDASLTRTGIFMLLVYTAVAFVINEVSVRYARESAELRGKSNSVMFQLLKGIDKIRISGAEERAAYEYMKPYVRLREVVSKSGNLSAVSSVISTLSGTIFNIVFYSIICSAIKKGTGSLSTGDFMAFVSLFGAFEAYYFSIVSSAMSLRSLKPSIERIKPILDTVPEYDDAKDAPGEISGGIEINNVSFAYSPEEPKVLNEINLNIKPGEYVGIVGPSGCGKSTLIRLLLGFEKPSSGKIYYDNKDIESVDKRELRKNFGVVLQNGRLISGSIYENITITAPDAGMERVNQVIKAVGLEPDIAKMPMGIHTMLSEESTTISGGQQQRILIARAIVSNPKILLFDEATSALDNITQSMVCSALDELKVTRIVIAHRLSTIINCDRIIVLNHGRIEEQGSFEELMANNGLFAQLAGRQMA